MSDKTDRKGEANWWFSQPGMSLADQEFYRRQREKFDKRKRGSNQ